MLQEGDLSQEDRRSVGFDGFVSYKRAELDAVRDVLTPLSERRFWIDDDDIEPGTDWRQRIERGIASSSAFLFMMTPASLQSRECLAELDTAVRFGKRVIPIHLAGDLSDLTIPKELASRHWIDATTAPGMAAPEIADAIDVDIRWVDAHSTLLARAMEWRDGGNRRSSLLRGERLDAANAMIAGASDTARPRIVELQREYVAASIDARRRRQRAGVLAGFVVTVIAALAIAAWIQRNRALAAEQEAASLRLASDSSLLLEDQLDLGILVALSGLETHESLRTRSAVINSLSAGSGARKVSRTGSDLLDAQLSTGGSLLAAIDPELTATARSTQRPDESIQVLGRGASVAISEDGRSVVVVEGETVRWTDRRVDEDFECRLNETTTAGAVTTSVVAAATLGDEASRVWLLDSDCDPLPIREVGSTVTALAFSTDGSQLAVGMADGNVVLWSVAQSAPLQPRLPALAPIAALRFSPDGRSLGAALGDGSVALWDLRDADSEPSAIPGPSDDERLTALDFSQDASQLIVGDSVGRLQVIDIRNVAVPGPILVNYGEDRLQSKVLDTRFGEDTSTAVSIHADGRIVTWDTAGRSPLWQATDIVSVAEDVVATGDGFVVATSSGVWDAPLSGTPPSVAIWTDAASAVAMEPGNGRLLIGTPEGELHVLNADGSHRELPGHTGAVNAVVWASGGDVAVSAGADGRILATDLVDESTSEMSHEEGYVADIVVTPDGSQLISVGFDRTIRIWSVGASAEIASLREHSGSVDSVAIDAAGRFLASGSDDRTILVWDLDSRTIVDRLTAHTDRVTAVAFSDDGTRLVSGSEDRSIIVWELEESAPLGQPLRDEFGSLPRSVAFSPGSIDRIIVGSAGLAIWELDDERLTSEACRIASGRRVTAAELERYFGEIDPFHC